MVLVNNYYNYHQLINSNTGEGVAFDYTLTTTTARADEDGTPRSVSFIFRADSIAQEPDETLTLRLDAAPGTTIPSGDGVFFQDTIDMTIIDGDGILP